MYVISHDPLFVLKSLKNAPCRSSDSTNLHKRSASGFLPSRPWLNWIYTLVTYAINDISVGIHWTDTNSIICERYFNCKNSLLRCDFQRGSRNHLRKNSFHLFPSFLMNSLILWYWTCKMFDIISFCHKNAFRAGFCVFVNPV